ncbi:thiamine pyrophosphate-binding protein [Blautia wexlerae]|uniref:Thiamine pyrophosphate-binding protein n=1 Tax=Blautia wexlerae TaxID=418240 RepID=A0ABX2GMH6_9FIRM|nr:thiamine pyrophosphate-binding protein [Blautia wexlerae]NSF73547.1 thiamine pyrophosphate-binding protein [Blautia wexlerae]
MKLSDYVVAFLQKKGIRHFFGYQGTMIAHLVDSIERNPDTENHSSYNEQGAAFAACGYAQAKEECACAYATSGPGAVNLLSGVADAYYDSLPVIFLTGQLNTYEYSGIKGLRQQGFQETDIVAMAKPITKYAVQIRDAEDIVTELNKAYHIATTGRRGPVLIDLPMNIQRGEVENPVYDMEFEEDVCGVEVEEAVETASAHILHGTDEAVRAICDELEQAKRPVIMLGHGVDSAVSQQKLIRFARSRQIPIITSVLAKSVLAYDDPQNFGCIGGAYGHRYANMIANAKSDLLLCFGISLCTRQIGTKVNEFAKGAKIIRIDLDPYNLQRNIHENGENEIKILAETGTLIQALDKVPCREQEGISDWMVVCSEIRENLQAVDDALPERYPNRMIGELSDMLKDTGAIAVDVGQHMVWSYQSFKNREGQKLLFSGGHGAMGYALPAAIGAYYATGKPTACICGDGAFQMNIQELEWVKRENLPVKIMVMNNEALGMIRHLQRDYFDCLFAGTTDGCGFASCDFSKVAAAYGIPSCRMHCEDVKEEAPQFMEGQGPKLLEVMLEHGTFAYPKTCLGEPIHNQQPYAPKSVYDHLMAL